MNDAFLPYLPIDRIRACYAAAPGNEIESGKFASPESSAALVANAFGLFLETPESLPILPGGEDWGWPPIGLALEAILRFPWSGGRHPCLDVLVETPSTLIGIESKRYEPYRTKATPSLSEAYWRPVWGEAMRGFQSVRDGLRSRHSDFSRFDAPQLVKHAFGLRTAVHRDGRHNGKRAILVYLYAEPGRWPDGRLVPPADIEAHRSEIERFRASVDGDEVGFYALSYKTLLVTWSKSPDKVTRDHAAAIGQRYSV